MHIVCRQAVVAINLLRINNTYVRAIGDSTSSRSQFLNSLTKDRMRSVIPRTCRGRHRHNTPGTIRRLVCKFSEGRPPRRLNIHRQIHPKNRGGAVPGLVEWPVDSRCPFVGGQSNRELAEGAAAATLSHCPVINSTRN